MSHSVQKTEKGKLSSIFVHKLNYFKDSVLLTILVGKIEYFSKGFLRKDYYNDLIPNLKCNFKILDRWIRIHVSNAKTDPTDQMYADPDLSPIPILYRTKTKKQSPMVCKKYRTLANKHFTHSKPKEAVLRILDVYTGSWIRIFPSWIPGQKDSGSGSAPQNLSIFNQKLCF